MNYQMPIDEATGLAQDDAETERLRQVVAQVIATHRELYNKVKAICAWERKWWLAYSQESENTDGRKYDGPRKRADETDEQALALVDAKRRTQILQDLRQRQD